MNNSGFILIEIWFLCFVWEFLCYLQVKASGYLTAFSAPRAKLEANRSTKIRRYSLSASFLN